MPTPTPAPDRDPTDALLARFRDLAGASMNLRAQADAELNARANALRDALRDIERHPVIRGFRATLHALRADVFVTEWISNPNYSAFPGIFSLPHHHREYLCIALTPKGFQAGGSSPFSSPPTDHLPTRFFWGFTSPLLRTLVLAGTEPTKIFHTLVHQMAYVLDGGVPPPAAGIVPKDRFVLATPLMRHRELEQQRREKERLERLIREVERDLARCKMPAK